MRHAKLFLAALLIGLFVAIRYSGIGQGLTIADLKEARFDLLAFIDAHYWQSVISYIGIYIGVVVLALPLAAVCTLAGGFLFGVLPGMVYVNIGATVGATIFFLMIRYLFGTSLQQRYAEKLVWFNQEMEAHGIMYLFAIRFIAVIPFFVVNALIGMTNISLWTFIWTTAVSIIPSTLIYAFAGRKLAMINRIQDVFSPAVLFAFLLLALFAVLPVLAKKYGWWGIKQ